MFADIALRDLAYPSGLDQGDEGQSVNWRRLAEDVALLHEAMLARELAAAQ